MNSASVLAAKIFLATVMLVATWHWIFAGLAIFAALLLVVVKGHSIRNQGEKLDPGAPQESPHTADVPTLPANASLGIEALEASKFFREAFGDEFISYLTKLRRGEWERFVAAEGQVDMQSGEVTEWEHREYFELM